MNRVPQRPASKTSKAARPMTRRQLSRHQRDLRLQRITKLSFAAVIAFMVLVVAYGYWRENIAPAGETILSVRGTPISTQTYAKVLGYRQFELDRQIAAYAAFGEQQSRSAAGDENAALARQLIQQQVQQLQQQRAFLEGQVMEQMADDELIRHEADLRGIRLAAADLDRAIAKEFGAAEVGASRQVTPEANATVQPQVTAQPGSPESSLTPVPTPAPTATPMSLDQALVEKRKELDELGLMSEQEYRELIVRPSVRRDRLEALLGEEVPRSAEQVWARHILVDAEEEAREVLAKLQGGADFASLAKEVSKDTGSKGKGGDLDWFTRKAMVAEFDEAAFSLPVGQTVSEPVKTSFGFHVIQVLGHEQDRPLSKGQLDSARQAAMSLWLQSQRSDPNAVDYRGYEWSRMRWARDWVANNAKYLKKAS